MKIDRDKHMIIFFRFETGNHKLTDTKSIIINKTNRENLKKGRIIIDVATGQKYVIVGRSEDRLLILCRKKVYGVYNNMTRKWQFPSIQEQTASAASRKLYKLIGKDAYKWRFEIRGRLDKETI